MKFIIIAFLLFFNSPIQAQIVDLMQNDSITWIAEWDADYLIDDFAATDTVLNNGIAVLKYIDKKDNSFKGSRSFFTTCLWEAVKESKISVYSDSCFKKVLQNKAALYLGKARREYNNEPEISPIVYEQVTCSWSFPYTPFDVKFYRAHQIVYYNTSKAQFQMQTLAIAPLVITNTDVQGLGGALEPLFWFKPEMNRPNLSSDDIVWAQKIITKNNSLDFRKAKVLKNTMPDTLINNFLQSFENQFNIPFWGAIHSDYVLEKLDKQERQKRLNPVDSLLTVDPITYELKSTVTIKQTYYKPQDIKSIRLYQEWFWDERQNKLFIHLTRIAPTISVKNEEGEHLYLRPLFYRKTDD